jgi:hypothetical protein
MIMDEFSQQTVAQMEIALERACERFPKELSSHEARKQIAARILERAVRTEATIKDLTDAALAASAALVRGKAGIDGQRS